MDITVFALFLIIGFALMGISIKVRGAIFTIFAILLNFILMMMMVTEATQVGNYTLTTYSNGMQVTLTTDAGILIIPIFIIIACVALVLYAVQR
jgi:hypothetical protein